MSYLKVYSDEVDIGWLIFMFIYLLVKYEYIDLVCICRKWWLNIFFSYEMIIVL